jgi:hypothetical protein
MAIRIRSAEPLSTVKKRLSKLLTKERCPLCTRKETISRYIVALIDICNI